MAKLSLKANPTFNAKVGIPVAGGSPVDVEMTFKHRTRLEYAEWLKELEGKDKCKAVMECVTSWELEDTFNKNSVSELLNNYMGAADAIVTVYMKELSAAKVKN